MCSETESANRLHPRAVPREVQVQVFRRDRWLCRWCGYPVIFAPALHHLTELMHRGGFAGPLAYYNRNWRRRDAPLLDWLGALVDHVEAHHGGGPSVIANLATACNKCNARKSDFRADKFTERHPRIPVKGKYGDPMDWDGLSNLFVLLVSNHPEAATATERAWLRALKTKD